MSSKKSRRQEAARQKQAKKRRHGLWAVGLSVVLATGIALFAATRSTSFRPNHASKAPLTEPIQKKRKLTFNLMGHETAKSAFCGLPKVLDETRPDIVFMESAYLPREMIKDVEAHFNSPTISKRGKFGGPIRGLIDRLLKIIRKYRERSGNQTKLYAAESYSHSEIQKMRRIQSRFKQLMKQSDEAYLKGEIENTITFRIKGLRIFASYMKKRNDRILRRIMSRMDEPGSSALLIIGAGHKNLIRMFEEHGFSTQIVRKIELIPLMTYYETKERGWNLPPANEEEMAARGIAITLLSNYYRRKKFGEHGWTSVAEKVLGRFSVADLTKLWRLTNSDIEVPTALLSIGYNVPSTKKEFTVVSNSLGLSDCN